MNLRLLFIALALVVLMPGPTAHAQGEGEGWLVASRRTEGQADLWAMPAAGAPWQRLTSTPEDERWPAWHPDGQMLAYAARRDRNWDLYTLDLRTGEERRLTRDPHFDGWPAWSPDGEQIAFASARDGELDIFLLDVASGTETNLTPDAPALGFEPRWEDARHLLYVTTAGRTHDIARLDPAGRKRRAPDRQPRPRRAGAHAVALRRDAGPLGGGAGPRAASPPGGRAGRGPTFFVEQCCGKRQPSPRTASRWHGWSGVSRGICCTPVRWRGGAAPAERADERTGRPGLGQPDDARMQARLLPLVALPASAPQIESGEIVRLDDLDTPLPLISGRVVDSFLRLRARVAEELGDDYLGTVSEVLRPVDFSTAASDYLSWHKSGRAVDTLLSLGFYDGQTWLEIVREDWRQDVYWRIWLRCPVQDGSCGEPLIETPWDYSPRARRELAPGEGGVRLLHVPGYYVDFTRLAQDEGWTRISSYETPDFDWREEMVGMEFWHYQRTDGLRWFDTMRELYAPAQLEELFSWEVLAARDLPRWLLRLKGLPLPPAIEHAPAELVIP